MPDWLDSLCRGDYTSSEFSLKHYQVKILCTPAFIPVIFFKPLAANLVFAVEYRNCRLIRIQLLILKYKLLGLAVILKCFISVKMIWCKIRQ